MEVRYQSILPYLLEEKVVGNKLHCKFKIEHKVFELKTQLRNNKMGAELVSQMVSKAGVGKVRTMLKSFLKKNSHLEDDEETTSTTLHFTKEDKEIALVQAFESIQDELMYDKKLQKWRLITYLSPFETHIKNNPLTEAYDNKIMCRMLVEMAKADGRIDENERLFFEDFIDNENGKLGMLLRAVNLTEEDCYPLQDKNKASIFMMVCAVALTDHKLNDKEQAKLNRFASILGINEVQKNDLLSKAQDYSLQLFIISNDNQVEQERLDAFGRNIGMPVQNIQQTLKRLQ